MVEIIRLYAAQIFNFAIPILALSVLSKALEPEAFGIYVIIQTLTLLLSLIIEYGFNFSATRRIANLVGNTAAMQNIVTNIIGAKAVLSIIACTTLLVYSLFWNPQILPYQLFIIGLGAVFVGWYPLWYFQGQGKLSEFMLMDAAFKCLSLGLMMFFVRSPNDLDAALIFTVSASILSSTWGNFKVYRECRNLKFNFRNSLNELKLSGGMALYRLISTSIGNINTLVIASIFNPVAVASYSSAEKLAAGLRFFIIPFNQILLTRMAQYGKSDLPKAKKEFLMSLYILLLFSLIISMLGWFSASSIVLLFLGSKFNSSIDILRYLLLLTPLYVLGNCLSAQWMIPLEMDKAYNTIIAFAAIFNIVCIFLIVPKFGIGGLILTMAMTEAMIIVLILIYLKRVNMNPFGLQIAAH